MGKLSAGDLREQVILVTPAGAASDGYGGQLPAGPDSEVTRWARVRPLRGAEKQALGQLLSTEAYEVTLRHQPGGETYTTAQRVRWQGKLLDVQVVTPAETRDYVLLTCFTNGH